jgi:hypothetical protein
MFHNNILSVFIVVCWLYSTGECGVIASKKSLRGYMSGGNESMFAMYILIDMKMFCIFVDFPMKTNLSELNCSQFIDDYDILRQFPYPISVNLAADDDNEHLQTIAFMDTNDTFVKTLAIYYENIVPWSVYCLSNLDELQVYGTPFENGNFRQLNNNYYFVYLFRHYTRCIGKFGKASILFGL